MSRTIVASFALIISALCAHAQALPERLANVEIAAPASRPDTDPTNDIDRAKLMLANKQVGYTTKPIRQAITKTYRKKKKTYSKIVGYRVVGHELADVHYLLTVKRLDDDRIEIIRVGADGKGAEGYDIGWKRRLNGVNTHFVVKNPEGCVVLALKRAVRSERGFQEVVYVPFTDGINTLPMRQRGLSIMRAAIETARAELAASGIASRALPELGVYEVAPSDIPLTLAWIEHIDPGRMNEPIEHLMNEVLVIIAGNEDDAYAYAVSSARARGLYQFIPSTYDMIRRAYPKAGLKEDFVNGMLDHVNAAKAAFLLIDNDLAAVPLEKRRALRADARAFARYAAAAYNAGSGRAVKAYKDGTIQRKDLPDETKNYLEKYDKVEAVLTHPAVHASID